MKKTLIILSLSAILAACGTSKQATSTGQATKQTTSTGQTTKQQTTNTNSANNSAINYVRKVNDNNVYAKNIVSKIDFTLNAMGKDISVDGKLYMRKDEVIRIQLTPFGLMEVGRLEFTPDYVLLINRMEKEYVKATYNDLDFLKANGLDFYSLQSLFWNELFQPSKKALSDSDLSLYKTNMSEQPNRHITMQSGKLLFDWNTNASMARITETLITYAKGTSQASTVKMEYGDFVPMGSKRFPSKEKVTFNTKAFNTGKMTLEFLLNKITNDSDWEAKSSVPSKYKQISAQQFFAKLGNM